MVDSIIDKIRTFDFELVDGEAFKKSIFKSEYREISLKIFRNIEEVTKNNPDLIYQLGFEFGNKPDSLNYILAKSMITKEHNPESAYSKINEIAQFWETANLYKILAFFLSNQSFDPLGIKEYNKILKYFKRFGLDNNKRDKIRKIRNSWNHPFTIKNEFVLNEKGLEICNLSELDNLISITRTISNYNSKILSKCLFYNRNFSLFFLTGVYKSIRLDKEMHTKLFNLFMSIDPKKQDHKIEKDDIPNWLKQTYNFVKAPISYLKGMILSKAISNSIPQMSISRVEFRNIKRNACLKLIELSSSIMKNSIYLQNESKIELYNCSTELKKFAIDKFE